METTTKNARGWAIDPFSKTITSVNHNPDEYSELYGMLSHPDGYECTTFTVCAELENRDAVFIDDEGKLYGDLERQRFFILCLPDGVEFLIAGRALVFGTDRDGDTVDAKSAIWDVSSMVRFIPESFNERARRAALDEIAAGPTIMFFDECGNQKQL